MKTPCEYNCTILKRKGYGHSTVVYYCSPETLARYDGKKENVPLYVCGVYYTVNIDSNGRGVKHEN